MEHPRPEHPRPSFLRTDWINLNGLWSFKMDPGRSGTDRGFPASRGFDSSIVVPFCPESSLSGVSHVDFVDSVWYQRIITVPEKWFGKRIYLHFGGVDFETEVFVDGVAVGRHYGGSSSFKFDITSFITMGNEHNLVVAAHDHLRTGTQLGGKQSLEYASAGCFYTRTTGIWQTVWLEAVAPLGLEACSITPLVDDEAFLFTPHFNQTERGTKFRVTIYDRDGAALKGEAAAANAHPIALRIPNPNLWRPGSPYLYDILFEVLDEGGTVLDTVQSYAGMRKIHIENDRIFLNNEHLYLRFVLDQGFYQDGIWTAPTDAALKRDIELGIHAGFNGARLHQKVFEERFHYWADKLGYLTWAESPSWGLDVNSERGARNYLCEWREIVLRDRDHPSIIAWTTLNETWDLSNRKQHHRLHLDAYDLTRSLDTTRPINNASGGCHVRTDLYTVHIYEQDPEKLRETLDPELQVGVFRTLGDREALYEGQPYVVDEFGGIKWTPDLERIVRQSWGYGEPPATLDEFYRRLEGQVDALLHHSHISGYCYTQLTDVEQEQNGLYYYDRTSKFDEVKLRHIFQKLPASP